MILTFVSHLWKDFFRSASAGREIATHIALAFFMTMIAGYSLALGFSLEGILADGFKRSNPTVFLNGLLVYYFIGEFVTRYFMQSPPVMHAQPYLLLPIARRAIVHFLLGKSVAHVMNILVFLLFTPFALTVVKDAFGTSQAWIWLLSIWFVSMVNHFAVMLFKKTLDENIWGLVAFISVSSGLAAADYFGWFQLSTVSEIFFGSTLQGYTTVAMLLVWVTALYLVTHASYMKKLYPQESSAGYTADPGPSRLVLLKNFGVTGSWIILELKMIMRNSRTRTVFLTNIATIFYLLIFYSTRQNYNAYGAWIFFGLIGSGMFVINYGQYLFSWQGKHFDFLLVQPTSIRKFVESKYWLLASMTGLLFLLSIPYAYFGWTFLLVHFACTLYNIGINVFIVMNMAMWSPRSINLARGGALNYEGMGAAQWIMGIPIIVSPYIFYLPFKFMGYPIIGVMAVGVAGLIGIVIRKSLIEITSQRLFNLRYSIASNFRKD